ncbi:MAG: sulfite exporter TauE/SafE family protein [Candidatus Anstonellales archaeon]
MIEYIIYFVVGIFAGVIGGLLGTGGCALMMPVLRFGFDFPAAFAVGTTLTAVVFTAASGAIQHMKMGNVDKQTAIFTGISGILGVIIGSIIFMYISSQSAMIDLIVGVAFLVVSIRMIYEGVVLKQPAVSKSKNIPGKPVSKGILGAGVGMLTGVIGLGGGYALVPSYILLFKAPVKLAIGTSMAAFFWIALVGALFKIYNGVVDLPVAVALGFGALIGAIYGAKLVARFKPNILKTLFGILFFYVSLKYILVYFNIYI